MRSSEPSWKDLLVDGLEDETKRIRRSVGINFWPKAMIVVRDAAKARDMSMAAFVRRAAMAVACFDLKLDWSELLVEEPGVRFFDGTKQNHDAPREGKGHGPWRISNMYEGEHDGDDT